MAIATRCQCSDMRIAWIIAVTLLLTQLMGPLSSPGDSSDGDAKFARLLAEKNRLLRLRHQQSDDASVQTRLRHLAAEYKAFLRDHPQHIGAMVSYGGLLYHDHRGAETGKWWQKA